MATLMDGVYRLITHPTTTTTPLSQTTLLVLLFVVPLFLLLLHVLAVSRNQQQKKPKPKPKPLPPSPPGVLPIIGHLRLVGALPHVSLRALAAGQHKHGGAGGGLMLLRLGTVRNLVVSTPRAAQAVLRTHDHAFASRPAFKLVDDLGYGQASAHVAFAPYGDHWRQVRKLVTTHLFTVRKVHSYHLARQHEVHLLIDRLQEAAATSAEVDISEMVNAFSNDIVCHAVSGKFFRAEGRNKIFRELIKIDSVLAGGFSLENCFPGLANSLGKFMDWFMRNKAVEVHKRWDELLEKIICDHEERRRQALNLRQGDGDVNEESMDFIDVILSVQQEYGIDRDHMKGILMDMFEAGTGTSSLVLDLAMVELMRNPHLMTKLQDEVRNKTPKGQEIVKEENLASMAYLRAVVKETLRLHPPLPLLLPHQSMEDCDVDGYRIPSGTRVIINSYAINRDPETWENPEEFMPERFIDGGSAVAVDFKGNNFEFTPFGAGRRMCPGLNFGLATIEILLANLVYCFDWELPRGMKKEDIDMTEVFGVTVHRKEKLVLVPKKPHHALA